MSIIYEGKNNPLVAFPYEDMDFPQHIHPKVEIHHVIKGEFEIIISNKSYIVTKGDFILIMPNTVHEIKLTQTITFSAENSSNVSDCLICPLSECGEYFNLFTETQPVNPLIKAADLPSEIIMAIEKIKQHKDEKPRVARAFAQVIFAYAVSFMEFVPTDKGENSTATARLIHFIGENINTPLSLDLLSREIGINKYDISRIFNTTLNTSLPVYINNLRLEKAMFFLISSQMSITNIALECGYESLRNFNRQFKKNFGVSPREYRNEALVKLRTKKGIMDVR